MADKLRVDLESLRHSANKIANQGERLLGVHESSHAEATAGHAGWVGSSAAALSGLLDSWETATTAHIGRFGEHSCDLHFAAADFAEMEHCNAVTLREVHQSAGGPN